MSAETKKAEPVERIRVGGVQIPIWKNETKEGKIFHKAGEPDLSYRDGEAYKKSGSYSRRDLLNLIKAAALADSAISKLDYAANSSEETDEEDGE